MQAQGATIRAGVPLNLGIMSLPVSLYSAVGEDTASKTKTVCTNSHDPALTRQTLACEVCGNDGRGDHKFGKASLTPEGLVLIDQGTLDAAKEAGVEASKGINLTVHPAGEVSSVMMPNGKSYYLGLKGASEGTREAYTLLGELLAARPDLAFMARFSMKAGVAVTLYRLEVTGDRVLVLRQMADADLVRVHPVIDFTPVKPRALEFLGMLADSEAQPFIETSHGVGRTQIIAEYVAGATPVKPSDAAGTGNVLDLMAALEARFGAADAAKPAAKPAPKARKPRAKATA